MPLGTNTLWGWNQVAWFPLYSFSPQSNNQQPRFSTMNPSPTGVTKAFEHPSPATVKAGIQPTPAPQRKHRDCFLHLRFTHHLWFSVLKGTSLLKITINMIQCKQAHRCIWNLPQGFLFPGSLGVPAGQHTNKISINIMHQWAEFATAGGGGFYRRFYHRMGDRSDRASTYEMLTLHIVCSYRIIIMIRTISPLSTLQMDYTPRRMRVPPQ